MTSLTRSYLIWGTLTGSIFGCALAVLGVMRPNPNVDIALIGGGSALGLLLGMLIEAIGQIRQNNRIRRLRSLGRNELAMLLAIQPLSKQEAYQVEMELLHDNKTIKPDLVDYVMLSDGAAETSSH
jgi:hypothetical protein